MHLCAGAPADRERASNPLGVGLPAGCGPSDTGAQSHTQVLWKSSMCS